MSDQYYVKEKQEVHRKMKELYLSAISNETIEAMKSGKIVHMTITLGGPYIMWVEDQKKSFIPEQRKL